TRIGHVVRARHLKRTVDAGGDGGHRHVGPTGIDHAVDRVAVRRQIQRRVTRGVAWGRVRRGQQIDLMIVGIQLSMQRQAANDREVDIDVKVIGASHLFRPLRIDITRSRQPVARVVTYQDRATCLVRSSVVVRQLEATTEVSTPLHATGGIPIDRRVVLTAGVEVVNVHLLRGAERTYRTLRIHRLNFVTVVTRRPPQRRGTRLWVGRTAAEGGDAVDGRVVLVIRRTSRNQTGVELDTGYKQILTAVDVVTGYGERPRLRSPCQRHRIHRAE